VAGPTRVKISFSWEVSMLSPLRRSDFLGRLLPWKSTSQEDTLADGG
jgi:hypothetical protein